LGNREVVAQFDGGDITSDAGGLLLREVEKRAGIIRRFAACFRDYRDPRLTEFSVEELVAQRVYGFGLGYEGLNDHDRLRSDPADDPIHVDQEGKVFHGYYGHYCYLPLYIFCGEFLLCARLRRSNIDASAGVVDELKRIVGQIRKKWPEVKIILRGDSGFCREEILAWCESNGVDYVIGLAKNAVLIREIEKPLEKAHKKFQKTGK